jgi:hypothetical protein
MPAKLYLAVCHASQAVPCSLHASRALPCSLHASQAVPALEGVARRHNHTPGQHLRQCLMKFLLAPAYGVSFTCCALPLQGYAKSNPYPPGIYRRVASKHSNVLLLLWPVYRLRVDESQWSMQIATFQSSHPTTSYPTTICRSVWGGLQAAAGACQNDALLLQRPRRRQWHQSARQVGSCCTLQCTDQAGFSLNTTHFISETEGAIYH